jgi:DNA mismatch endonuclease (patch repair protein)
MDTLTPEMRSWNMSRIRGKDTKPELFIRSLLHAMGYRFRLKNANIPGKPDIILPRYKAVVFVHGCFWHRHKDCKYAYTPKSRIDFWQKKFEANVQRDQEISEQLKQLGWHQLIIWECEIKNIENLKKKIKAFFRDL